MWRISLSHTTCLPAGRWSSGQPLRLGAVAYHPACGQSHRTQKRRRLLLNRRWWSHTHPYSPSTLANDVRSILCLSDAFTLSLHTDNSFLWLLLAVDTAAEMQPKKEAASIDSTLSPVCEVVAGVPKETQTQALPTSSPLSNREKVRNTWRAPGRTPSLSSSTQQMLLWSGDNIVR